MDNPTLKNFLTDYYYDVMNAMHRADEEPRNTHYRLGIKWLAGRFFDKWYDFNLHEFLPDAVFIDVDEWFAGRLKIDQKYSD